MAKPMPFHCRGKPAVVSVKVSVVFPDFQDGRIFRICVVYPGAYHVFVVQRAFDIYVGRRHDLYVSAFGNPLVFFEPFFCILLAAGKIFSIKSV